MKDFRKRQCTLRHDPHVAQVVQGSEQPAPLGAKPWGPTTDPRTMVPSTDQGKEQCSPGHRVQAGFLKGGSLDASTSGCGSGPPTLSPLRVSHSTHFHLWAVC